MNKFLLKQFSDSAINLGVELKTILIDEIQAFFLEEFYKSPASIGTVLFGGGRFRHLNNSIRFSVDLDFFQAKGFDYPNIVDFISTKFAKLLKQKFGVQARIIDIPPWQKSHNIETIRLLVYDEDSDFYQLQLDFDFIMRKPIYSNKGLLRNVVIIAGSDAESLEEKLISIYERDQLKVRDIFDFWYYRNLVKGLDKENIRRKIQERNITKIIIEKQLEDFNKYRNYYLKEIQNVIKSCGEKRPEVQNLLKLDINIILDYIINITEEYIL